MGTSILSKVQAQKEGYTQSSECDSLGRERQAGIGNRNTCFSKNMAPEQIWQNVKITDVGSQSNRCAVSSKFVMLHNKIFLKIIYVTYFINIPGKQWALLIQSKILYILDSVFYVGIRIDIQNTDQNKKTRDTMMITENFLKYLLYITGNTLIHGSHT